MSLKKKLRSSLKIHLVIEKQPKTEGLRSVKSKIDLQFKEMTAEEGQENLDVDPMAPFRGETLGLWALRL